MFKIIALVGASGSGKTEIQKTAEKVKVNVLYGMKTRPYRNGEDKSSYEHVTPEYFLTEHKKGNVFCETIFDGNLYGVHQNEIEPHRINIVTVDPIGLAALRKRFKKRFITAIYMEADEATRAKRMALRGDSAKQIEERLTHDRKVFANCFELCEYKITSGTKEENIVEFLDILREIKEDEEF